MSERQITVVQVVRGLGLPPESSLTWSVGARAARMWLLEHGSMAAAERVPKTTGAGTHRHNVYPESWRPRIEALIKQEQRIEAMQRDLFAEAGEPPPPGFDGLPVAWAVFAKVGGRWVLQHPIRGDHEAAQEDASQFVEGTELQVLPLVVGNV